MSATSSSADPVQTVIDLLSGTAAGDWPGGTKPGIIEKQWQTPLRTKSNQSDPAAYVWSSAEGTRDQLGVDDGEYGDAIQRETVEVDVWAIAESDATSIADDVVAILEDYGTDTRENTVWVTIRPNVIDDRRAETLARRSDHHVVAVAVELMRDAGTGT